MFVVLSLPYRILTKSVHYFGPCHNRTDEGTKLSGALKFIFSRKHSADYIHSVPLSETVVHCGIYWFNKILWYFRNVNTAYDYDNHT
jgi:hypothetical protein